MISIVFMYVCNFTNARQTLMNTNVHQTCKTKNPKLLVRPGDATMPTVMQRYIDACVKNASAGQIHVENETGETIGAPLGPKMVILEAREKGEIHVKVHPTRSYYDKKENVEVRVLLNSARLAKREEKDKQKVTSMLLDNAFAALEGDDADNMSDVVEAIKTRMELMEKKNIKAKKPTADKKRQRRVKKKNKGSPTLVSKGKDKVADFYNRTGMILYFHF